MGRALLLGGGAAKGAVQVAPVEGLVARHGLDAYDVILGVSTGSLTGVMAAMGKMDVLRAMYGEMDGTGYFMRPNVERLRRGLNTLKPLRKKLREHVRLADLRVPYGCGVVNLQSERYRNVMARTRRSDAEMHAAILASCAEPLIMDWWPVRLGKKERVCVDGGLIHVIPDLPRWHKYDAIDVVACQPLDRKQRRRRAVVDGLLEIASRTVEIWCDEVVGRDLDRLRGYAREGADVTVYAPVNPGKSLDASAETIHRRLHEVGPAMWASPVRLSG